MYRIYFNTIQHQVVLKWKVISKSKLWFCHFNLSIALNLLQLNIQGGPEVGIQQSHILILQICLRTKLGLPYL